MADKRISQLIERVDIANNDVLPIVASGATTTNKVTVSTLQDWMQDNLDVGVTSVGLTMPSAFQVSGSPITTSGNITVTATGTASQYIRGDGTLADFPQGGGGGGASVSYYLNGSVSQGTIGGVTYLEMNKTPVLGAGTDFNISADGYIASFITDAGDPSLLEIPAGNWNFETYFQASSAGGTPSFYVELYKVSGATATLIASNSANPELIAFGTSTTPYFSALAVPQTTLALTDRLAIRIYVVVSGRTITLHTENSNLCQVITTFTTGLTALNGLTAQVQNFATGTSGTDFNISSTGSIHTFNLPDASASNRGAVTTGSQIFGGVKTFANGLSLSAVGGSNQVTRIVNIGTLHEGSATLNQIGFNSGNNIYFGKGLNNGGVISWNNAAVRYYTLPDADGTIALTSQIPANPVGGTGTTNQIPKFSATSTLTNSNISDNGTEVNIQSRVFVTSGGQQFVFTPNLATTSNRIETTGSLPLEIVSGGNIRFAAGGTTPQITLATTGAVTLTGALNGTSASFSGTVNDVISVTSTASTTAIKLNNTNANDWGSNIAFQSSSVNKGFVGLVGSLVGNTDHSICLFGAAGQSIKFFTNANTSPRLTIDSSTGAATFSSKVNLTEGIQITSFESNLHTINGTLSYYSPTNGVYLNGAGASGWLRLNAAGTENDRNSINIFGSTASSPNSISFRTNNNTALTIGSSGAATFSSSVTANRYLINGSNGNSGQIIQQGDLFGTAATNLLLQSSSGNSIGFLTNGTNDIRMFINTSGNVGIGTASPGAYRLYLQGNNAIEAIGIGFNDTGTNGRNYSIRSDQGSFIFQDVTGSTERMRITSDGQIRVNQSGNIASGRLEVSGANSTGSFAAAFTGGNTTSNVFNIYTPGNRSSDTTYTSIQIGDDNATRLRIFANGNVQNTNGSYGSISDAKLKENIEDATPKLDDLMKVKVRNYNLIGDDKKQIGVIAQELEEVFPAMIDESEDFEEVEVPQVDEEGNEILNEEGEVVTTKERVSKGTTTKSVKYSVFVPMLIKAMQEQQEQIKSLTEQVEALKSQING